MYELLSRNPGPTTEQLQSLEAVHSEKESSRLTAPGSSSGSMQGSNSQDAPIYATESLQVRQRCLLWTFGQQDNSVSDQGQPIAARGQRCLSA